MNIPPKYEDVVAQLEASNKLCDSIERSMKNHHHELGLSNSREAALLEELERAKSRYDREVLGLNNEGDPIGGDPAGGYRNDLARVNAAFDELAACVGFSSARLDQTGDSPIDCANQLQQRLTVAEKLLQRVIDSSVLSFEQDTPEELESLEADICAALKPAAEEYTSPLQHAGNLSTFAKEVIYGALEGGSFDGADIQEIAVNHGLLKIETRTEECGEVCACREYGFPSECYRKSDLLELKPAAEGEGS